MSNAGRRSAPVANVAQTGCSPVFENSSSDNKSTHGNDAIGI